MDNKIIIIAQSGQPCAGSGVASREALILDTIKSMHWPGKTMARRAASRTRVVQMDGADGHTANASKIPSPR